MKTINKIVVLAAAAAMITLGAGCQKEPMRDLSNDNGSNVMPDQTEQRIQGAIGVRLIGSNPGEYRALHLNVMSLSVKLIDARGGEPKWFTTLVRPTIYNVMQYNVAAPAMLADLKIPTGMVSEVRLNLGNRNTLVWVDKDGRHAMTLPLVNNAPSAASKVIIRRSQRSLVMLDLNVLSSLKIRAKKLVFDPALSVRTIDYTGPDLYNDPK